MLLHSVCDSLFYSKVQWPVITKCESTIVHVLTAGNFFLLFIYHNKRVLHQKYVGGLRATRSLSVEVPGIWIYIFMFFNLYSSSDVLSVQNHLSNTAQLLTVNPINNHQEPMQPHIQLSFSPLPQKVRNLNNLNVGTQSGLLTMRIINAFPNDLNKFPVDNQTGINKPIRKPMKVWQLHSRGSLKPKQPLWCR